VPTPTSQRKKTSLPRYDERRGRWIGGDSRTLYTFTGIRTGGVGVYPGGGAGKHLLMNWGPEATVRAATRAEAEEHWQSPLHIGWKVTEGGSHHATKKYGSKTAEKVEQTMHEFKRGKLKSGSGGKVTSRKQAIAIGLSQARRRGYKVPPSPTGHATMKASIDDRVRAHLSNMRPGQEIDARGMARAIGGVEPLEVDYALERAKKAGLATSSDGRWFGPAGSSTAHAKMLRSPVVRVESVKMPNNATAEIHIHHGKGGYSGVLVLSNGNELPMALGVPVPKTAAEAVRGAKKFLANVYGRSH
jgi:hypothetical protein